MDGVGLRIVGLSLVVAVGCGDSEDAGGETDVAASSGEGSQGSAATAVSSSSGSTTGSTTEASSAGPSTSDTGDTGDSDTTSDPPSGMTFEERCAAPGVIACYGLDSQAEADMYMVDSGFTPPAWDSGVAADGAGSARLDVLPGSPANTSGNVTVVFEPGVGEGQTLYVQWRQRFSSEFLATDFDSQGWKQLIINENTSTAGCSPSEVVVTSQAGFPIIYHACGIFEAVTENPVDDNIYEFNRQPGGDNRCLYSWYTDGAIDHVEPTDDVDELACIGYVADEWMTFQVAVHLDSWCTGAWEDCPANNRIEMWVSNESGTTSHVLDWPWPLIATTDPADTVYNKLAFTPYQTDKNPDQNHPPSSLWYDSIIVSTERIPDP